MNVIPPHAPSMPPRFSILMAAYQAEATIARAIKSVLAQTYDAWELIVVDDGSRDTTRERALEAAGGDTRITVLTQANAGPGTARNHAADHARGEYLCILDSDDEYSAEYLARMAECADSAPEAALLSCNSICINPDGTRSQWLSGRGLDRPQSFTLDRIIRHNDIFIMCAIRADAFHAVGGFNTVLAPCEDYDLWLRLLANGFTHHYTPELLGVYYRMPGSASSNRAAEARALSGLFEDLIASGKLTTAEVHSARRRIRAASGRADLERRRVERDFDISRRDALLTANAFAARWRRVVARAMALVHPRWYIRVFADRRNGQEAALYSAARTNPDFPHDHDAEVSR